MTETAKPTAVTGSPVVLQPFTFRSGGLFGSGKRVQRVKAAVQHMDRHPQDGIYHLRNGSLAEWLEQQGEDRLAEAARQAVSQRVADPRITLETFLIGTGLVARPRLWLRPESLRMGYVLAGQTATCELQIRRGLGRGYLFGKLQSQTPCLRVAPTTFAGGPFKASVSVDTEPLPISRAWHEERLAIDSNAAAEPLIVPVRLRVMGMPSRLNRYVVRPLAGMVPWAVLGLGVGWLLFLAAGDAGGSILRLPGSAATSPWAWAGVGGALWGVLGAIAGLLHPPAIPILYATGQRLLRFTAWAAAAVVSIAVATGALLLVRRLLGMPSLEVVWSALGLTGIALAAIPAMGGEIRAAWKLRTAGSRQRPRRYWRPVLVVVSTIAICSLLVAGAWLSRPALRDWNAQGVTGAAAGWIEGRLTHLDQLVNRAVDQIYLRFYDRRAPLQPPGGAPATPVKSQDDRR